MVIVGVVVSQPQQVVGEVCRSALLKELLLWSHLGDVGDISGETRGSWGSRDLRLLVFQIVSVGVEATIERPVIHKAVTRGWG